MCTVHDWKLNDVNLVQNAKIIPQKINYHTSHVDNYIVSTSLQFPYYLDYNYYAYACRYNQLTLIIRNQKWDRKCTDLVMWGKPLIHSLRGVCIDMLAYFIHQEAHPRQKQTIFMIVIQTFNLKRSITAIACQSIQAHLHKSQQGGGYSNGYHQ